MISKVGLRASVQGIQFIEPRLYDVLMALIDRINDIDVDVQEVARQIDTATGTVVSPSVNPVTVFSYTLFSDYVKLTWVIPNDVANFEIRKGSTWDSALRILITNNDSAVIDPLTVGTHTYLIKSIDSSGTYSTVAKSVDIVIPAIPAVSIRTDVIDNNVLLYWNAPTSTFRISYYTVKRNGVVVGTKDGTFTTYFEQIAGTNTYGIIAVDIAGNQNAEATIDVTVNQPPDYELVDTFTSTFTGTKTNCEVYDGVLYATLDTTETFEDHFDNNVWASPQDQIDAGYPIYIEPTKATGSYEEVFDEGTVIQNVIINAAWTTEVFDDTVNVTCKIAVSDDNITYTAFSTGTTYFASSVRYVKVKLEFAAGDRKLIGITNFRVILDVKKVIDSGYVAALAADASGTTVTFNLAFRDIDSIIATVNSTSLKTVIIDFTDAPDPTDFKVLVFDSAGSRVDADVYWVARGII